MTAVLFTCAGQRVDIVRPSARAGATTIAADVNPLAPALYHADRLELVPRVDDPGYVAALRELVERARREAGRPAHRPRPAPARRERDQLGALVLLPEAEVVERRWPTSTLAHGFFEERGLPSPPTWLPTEVPADLRFPCS